jgi:hypothetical protein
MEIARFIYQDNPNYEVEFEPTNQDNIMVNATMMAAIFGKLPKDFLKNDDTKSFIKACLKKENSPYLNVKNESDLVTSKQKSGTWMHRILALKFAAWLDSDFEVWVYITIDRLLNQFYREQRDARLEKLRLKARKETLKNKFLLKYPDFAEYVELEELEKESDSKLIKSVKKQLNQLRIDFPELQTPSLS